MNEEKFNIEMRKFLKLVGITSQREIEKAVNQAIASGKIQGSESLKASITLDIGAIDLHLEIENDIALE
jgi:hypothetical protein